MVLQYVHTSEKEEKKKEKKRIFICQNMGGLDLFLFLIFFSLRWSCAPTSSKETPFFYFFFGIYICSCSTSEKERKREKKKDLYMPDYAGKEKKICNLWWDFFFFWFFFFGNDLVLLLPQTKPPFFFEGMYGFFFLRSTSQKEKKKKVSSFFPLLSPVFEAIKFALSKNLIHWSLFFFFLEFCLACALQSQMKLSIKCLRWSFISYVLVSRLFKYHHLLLKHLCRPPPLFFFFLLPASFLVVEFEFDIMISEARWVRCHLDCYSLGHYTKASSKPF